MEAPIRPLAALGTGAASSLRAARHHPSPCQGRTGTPRAEVLRGLEDRAINTDRKVEKQLSPRILPYPGTTAVNIFQHFLAEGVVQQ